MLDLRVYRAAFLPALVALFVAAFSLADRPEPAQSPSPPDAFDAERAFGGRAPLRNSLTELARSFPERTHGSADDAGLADRVAETLGRPDRTQGPAFQVTRESTGDVETVIGVRPGLSSRRIVVLSHRDGPGLASLSGTAAMLELARLFRARELTKTLVLVSTSGATDGFTGARAWASEADDGSVDAVLVLGDMAGARPTRPWAVPWSLGLEPVPLRLQRTVEAALRAEAGGPGGSRAIAQWLRRAWPFTVSEQGVVADQGIPAVMIGASGERGPAPDAEVRRARLEGFGRAALRAVTAIDAAGPANSETATPFEEGSPSGIVTLRNVLPDWSVRLLVGTLLLPAFLTALDGFFRVRRRRLPVRPWILWLLATAAPVLLAWLWVRALGLTGALEPPEAPVLPLPPVEGIALGSVALILLIGWFGVRPLILVRTRDRDPARRPSPAAGALAAAAGACLCLIAALVWTANPYAAALLLPAAHLWMFASAPASRLRGWWGAAAVAAGLLPFALLIYTFARALALDPLELAWMAMLSAASGQLSFVAAVVAAALVASLAALLTIMRTRRRMQASSEPEPLRTRGPASYAGPGSLGGTESALRR